MSSDDMTMGALRRARQRIDLGRQTELAAEALKKALAERDLPAFYRVFRSTDLPFLGLVYDGDAAGLFRACAHVLHRLGGISPAVALAVENHFYVSSAIATFPIGDDERLEARRRALLSEIVEKRRLVANTNSRVHGDRVGAVGTRARKVAGGYAVSGAASYTSLATEGDLLIFTTALEEGFPAVLMTRPRGNAAVEIGPYLFRDAMIDSDTRRIVFHDLFVPEEDFLLGGQRPEVMQLLLFEMVWHQALIPALYLGAAAQAIEESRRFLRAVRTREGGPLAELDGMVVDVGRLVIRYRAACAAVREAGEAMGTIRRAGDRAERLPRLHELAGAAKYAGTRCAEEIVAAARGIVGARAYAGDSALERLCKEVVFGPLGPEVNAVIERAHGRRALGEGEFDGAASSPWLDGAMSASGKEETC
ncbi:acyl-CoA dehydrogenase family protein [Sorangium sp. So ce1097]|uniref:acyl-CoA dehydrogenase family protein n=1 Tax=Sorangium sp. So ce1097 TaxID=3133330 RepID=UPI003F5D68AE